MFSWYYIEGILIQSCYTLLIVLGLSILTGYTGMFSFGHAGFVCIGAYVSILCTMAFGLPYWLSLIIAGLAAMLYLMMEGAKTGFSIFSSPLRQDPLRSPSMLPFPQSFVKSAIFLFASLFNS